MSLSDLYYVDWHERRVKAAPYTRDRAMDAESATPTFYHTRRDALGVLFAYLRELMNEVVSRYHEVKKELEKN